jgi:small conductance mechanosensitive channel
MDVLTRLTSTLANGRLGANLIAIHGLITVTVLLSLALRRFIIRGGNEAAHWSGLHWLQVAGEEAARRARIFLFWLTLAALLALAGGGVAYHLAGRDARDDVRTWYAQFSAEEVFDAGLHGAAVLATLAAAWCAVRTVRRLRPALERLAARWAGQPEGDATLGHFFRLLHNYVTTVIRVTALWAVLRLVGVGPITDTVYGHLVRILTVVVAARLLALSCRIVFRNLQALGNSLLGEGPYHRYWQRAEQLVPLAEHCFDAAVYVVAGSLCLRQVLPLLQWGDTPSVVITFLIEALQHTTKVVVCIVIFFGTRLVVELSHVLLAEAFGLEDDSGPVDQKRKTLVPLLGSVSQYVLYFGSVLMMLSVLGVPTAPIMAGAGIVGLAVGLGAQSLVTDVVSGFFILFEDQFLVGDYVKIGDAAGTIEAVGIRVTQLRDGQGKLHIIPNGQIKGVVSYSKGYVNAVVDLKVPSGSDLEAIFRAMAEAGQRLRKAHREVLAETQIHGLIDLGTSDMTVRAVTRVRPGCHGEMQSAYRRLLKQVLDETEALDSPRAKAA